jgi:predicted secreted hydrolase
MTRNTLFIVLAVTLLVLALVTALAAVPAEGTPLPQAAPAFAQAHAIRDFSFPRDHGPHPDYRQEWWYVTGNLDAEDGARFGFELTFFRVALAPPARVRAANSSAWRTQTLYVAHFAITDAGRGEFRSAQKLAREALGLAGASAAPFAVWIDDWSLAASATGPWHLHAQQPDYTLDLDLVAQDAPVLNGDHGLSRKSDDPDSANYYYSIPHLAAHGQLTRSGTVIALQGRAWLDREWGSGGLAPNERGWDWFALQFEDGSALMFYSLRRTDGSRDPHSAGTFLASDGSTHPLATDQVLIGTQGFWQSPRGGRYPAAWHVQVPTLALDLRVRPVISDQELDTTPRYWEGAVDAEGTRAGRALRARGYVELVGYAQERGQRALTGAAAAVDR